MSVARHMTALDDIILSDGDYQYFQERIRDLAGITLKPIKKDMVKNRLRSHMAELSLTDLSAYRSYLESLPSIHPEWQSFINLLTTNRTNFFRETEHFDFLVREFLPAWLKLGQSTLHIWSAASSTGEEPYTLAMVLAQHLPADRTFKILATDIDTKVLATASNGVYPKSVLDDIPDEYRQRFVSEGTRSVADWFRIDAQLKKHIEFTNHNLIEPRLPGGQVFDMIFCRNVLIYFSKDTVAQVAHKFYRAVRPGGYLVIGHAESLQGSTKQWQTVSPSIYKRD